VEVIQDQHHVPHREGPQHHAPSNSLPYASRSTPERDSQPGQVQGSAAPGLILTPPPKGTKDAKALERDDGFLTVSEIASLKLDADWVILSACNTAGGGGETETGGPQALSGMAGAFFYAGARTLLVSHWEVGSDAAVKLTTRAFAELAANPRLGRAEALELSMRELIATGTPEDAHPSTWAPFVVVGEGHLGREIWYRSHSA
jgi:CHAT domain-containing protein